MVMVNQMTMASDGGGAALGAAVAAFEAKHGTAGESEEYRSIPQVMDEIERAKETARRMDEQKSSSFWAEVGEFFDHGWDYWEDKRRFDAQVAQLLNDTEAAVAQLRATIQPAVDRIPIPDELMATSESWKSSDVEVRHVSGDGVPNLKDVKGWSGPAYDSYKTMWGVQNEACTEWGQLPGAMEATVMTARKYNLSVLSAVHGYLKSALNTCQRCYIDSSKEFYVNTANVLHAVGVANGQIHSALTMVEGVSGQLQRDVDRAQAAPIVISTGWPSGSGQAGQKSGTVDVDSMRGRVPEGPQTGGPRSAVDGVHR